MRRSRAVWKTIKACQLATDSRPRGVIGDRGAGELSDEDASDLERFLYMAGQRIGDNLSVLAV